MYPVTWLCDKKCANAQESILTTHDAVQVALDFLYSGMWREYPEKCVANIQLR